MSSHKIIAICLPDDRIGGAENVMRKIAMYYLQKNYVVHIFFLKKKLSGEWNDLHENCVLHFTNSSSEKFGILSMVINMFKISRKNTILYTYSSHIHIIGLLSLMMKLNLYKTKKLITRELTVIFERFNSFRLCFFKALYKISINFVDLKIFQTHEMLISFNENLNFAEKFNSIVLHNPINLDELESKVKEETESFEFKYLVACGRLNKVKGFDILLNAFCQIENKEIHLVIIGDGPEKQNLLDQLENLKCKENIHFLGHKKNPIPYFKNAFGCILSSRVEGFPNVLLEMMSQNGRVLSTKCAGGIDKIENIVLAEKENLDSLIQGLNYLLKIDQEKCKNNKMKNLDFLSKHTIDNYIAQIESSLEYSK